jgi:MYXO-CTERM domain-containing protein
MQPRALRTAVVLLVAAAGCGPGQGIAEPTGRQGQPIVNGTPDSGDPAVVLLFGNGYIWCSAALITPEVVLTAAHCVPPNIEPQVASEYSELEVYFGNNALTSPGETIPVADGWTHPGWNINVYEDDIALLALERPATTTPIPVNTTMLRDPEDVGRDMRVVGFGITYDGGSDNGVKRQTTANVDAIYPAFFTMSFTPGGTCSGDSGGPTLMMQGQNEVVAGVHSRSDCVSSSFDTRVAWYLDEIEAFVGSLPPSCGADGECASGCPAVDPDCPCADDGFCDELCTMPESDPDCQAECAQDGMCVADCLLLDPDCCAADATCNEECSDDPDCAPPADGRCDASRPGDPDCWGAGNLEDLDYDGEVKSSGCSYVAGGSTAPSGAVLAALLAAAALVRRRRSPHAAS